MRYRIAALVFFALLGVLELGDFAGNVTTLADESRLAEAARFLGVTEEGQRIRLTLLLPLTALIAALSLSVAAGAALREYRRSRRLLVVGLLFFYTVFQALTAIVFEPAVAAFALLFAALCLIAWWFVHVTPDPNAPRSSPAET